MTPDIAIVIADTDQHVLAFNALRHSLEQFAVRQVIIFSDRPQAWPGYAVNEIPKLVRIEDYNLLITRKIAEVLSCERALVIQFDGFVINGGEFSPIYAHYDYLGAPWPDAGPHDVGNGGFSLRSRRLIEAVAGLPYPDPSQAEDVFVCQTLRPSLEALGLRFAPKAIAAHFSVEFPPVPWPTFGFHGIFHLPNVYRNSLDFLIEHLSDRIVLSRSNYLMPAIERFSASAAQQLLRRLDSLNSANIRTQKDLSHD